MKKLIRGFACATFGLGQLIGSQAIAQQRAPVGYDNDAEYLATAQAFCDNDNYLQWGYSSYQQCFDDIMSHAPAEGEAPSLITIPVGEKFCFYPGAIAAFLGGC
jgi:hypothetical protein